MFNYIFVRWWVCFPQLSPWPSQTKYRVYYATLSFIDFALELVFGCSQVIFDLLQAVVPYQWACVHILFSSFQVNQSVTQGPKSYLHSINSAYWHSSRHQTTFSVLPLCTPWSSIH